ncbi:MAG: alanine--tRNA ligase-related protein [Candidatus Pacebacteria bacterium]|nr:alanine--tRNA ligase-related protein [Candidatus Paceibacterota bacterium]
MKSQEIRDKFLRFFEKRGHKVMPSSSLIPEDRTVLFTTAGMQQFKKYYLNPKEAPASRVTTIQKCFRTSDIEEVGDKTHLTFFEMMGNFSFNDYFKEDTIKWAWEFLAGKEGLKIDKKRISATYFKGDKEKVISEDKESLEILKKIEGLSKIEPQGFKDNFWSLGTEGSPGGPTVEFYIDGVEIWNLVFNEYIFENGKYKPSEFKGVDTGMGLERLTAILQEKDNVFETDLFIPIFTSLEKELKQNPKILRIISDHIKASCFLIDQGIIPASKHKKGEISRGSVLRTLLKKSIIYASLASKENWYFQPIKETIKIYKYIYPGLKINEEKIIKVIQTEEKDFTKKMEEAMEVLVVSIEPIKKAQEAFIKSINQPMQDFKKMIDKSLVPLQNLGKELKHSEKKMVLAVDSFRNQIKNINDLKEAFDRMISPLFFDLHQSFGLPINISIQEAKKRGLKVNEKVLKNAIDQEAKKHQEISRKGADKKFKGGLADESYETIKLHTTAHLLLQALREVFGEHVVQKGSNITQERLRFDFSYSEKLTDEQIKKVEDLVNKKIKDKLPVSCQEMTLEEAKKKGAMGVFEERYGDKVKVYSVGDFSKEICGGPHIKNTRELGEFKIKKQESVGAGIRRIKAVLL